MSINFELPQSQEDIAKAAFQSTVAPLQEAFTKEQEALEERLGTRGIAFGGAGRDIRLEQLGQQTKEIGRIAQGIGAQLGQSAMDQAFAAAESAKSRKFQGDESALERETRELMQKRGIAAEKDILKLQQVFTKGEREAIEKFQTGERLGAETFTKGEREAIEKFQTGEREAIEKFQTGERLGAETFTKTEREAIQAFTTSEREAMEAFETLTQEDQQAFLKAEAETDRVLKKFLANEQLTSEEERFYANIDFNVEQNELNRSLQKFLAGEQISSAEKMQLLEQQWKTAENSYDRTLKTALTDKQLNFEKENRDLQLIASGNITGDAANQLITSILGSGVSMTSDQQVEFAQMAQMAGLSVKDFGKMKARIGEEQWKLINEDPSQFIDDPVKNRTIAIGTALLSTGEDDDLNKGLDILVDQGAITQDIADKIKEEPEVIIKYVPSGLSGTFGGPTSSSDLSGGVM